MRRQLIDRDHVEVYEVDDSFPPAVDERQTYIVVHPPRRRHVSTTDRWQRLFLRSMILFSGALVILFLVVPQAMLAAMFERVSYIFLVLLVSGAVVGWVLGAWELIADLFREDWQ